MPIQNTVMYFPRKHEMLKWKNMVCKTFRDKNWSEPDQTAQPCKSDVFMCGVSAFPGAIYQVCAADSTDLHTH